MGNSDVRSAEVAVGNKVNFSRDAARFLFTQDGGGVPSVFLSLSCVAAQLFKLHCIVFISNSDCKRAPCNGRFSQSRLRNILLLVDFLWTSASITSDAGLNPVLPFFSFTPTTSPNKK